MLDRAMTTPDYVLAMQKHILAICFCDTEILFHDEFGNAPDHFELCSKKVSKVMASDNEPIGFALGGDKCGRVARQPVAHF